MYHLLLLSLVVVMGSSQAFASWNITNQDLIGKVVHVESLLHRGEWWSSRKNLVYGRWVGVDGLSERDVYYHDWTQFKVMSCDDGKICFESMKYKDYYIDGESENVGLTHSNFPTDKAWAQWTVECEDGKLSKCRFLSASVGRYMAVNFATIPVKSKWAITGPYCSSSHFRILSPVPTDYMASLLVTENQSYLDQQKEITFYVGVTKSTTHTRTIHAGLSVEIGCSMARGGPFLSGEWKTETTKTFEASRETKYVINLPPQTRINFQQLTGVYGPFKIGSRKFVIKCTLLRTGAPCSSESMLATYSMAK